MIDGQVNIILFAHLANDPTDIHVVRDDMKQALDDYAAGSKPSLGGFLYALLSNNLEEAARRADPYNKLTLVALAFYVLNNLPAECHGSERAVDAWLEDTKREMEKTREFVGAKRKS